MASKTAAAGLISFSFKSSPFLHTDGNLRSSLLFSSNSTGAMAVPALQFNTSADFQVMTLVEKQRANARKESPRTINIRKRKKFNGTSTKPRLSVFCSTKQLYAMLVDDENNKCLYYGSTLQKSLNESSSSTTIEAAERLGEELVKACENLRINEISSYDRNGFSRGERFRAFEIAISRHGFLPR